jgi:hypothetical protein
MPRGDRTGPLGQGPMTGRGMGYCAGYDIPGFLNRPSGWGGFGRGWRHRYHATGIPGPMAGRFPFYGHPAMRPVDELKALEEEAAFLERSLGEVKKRLEELEGKKE